MICPIDAIDCPYYKPKGGKNNTCGLKNPSIQCDDYITYENSDSDDEEDD